MLRPEEHLELVHSYFDSGLTKVECTLASMDELDRFIFTTVVSAIVEIEGPLLNSFFSAEESTAIRKQLIGYGHYTNPYMCRIAKAIISCVSVHSKTISPIPNQDIMCYIAHNCILNSIRYHYTCLGLSELPTALNFSARYVYDCELIYKKIEQVGLDATLAGMQDYALNTEIKTKKLI